MFVELEHETCTRAKSEAARIRARFAKLAMLSASFRMRYVLV